MKKINVIVVAIIALLLGFCAGQFSKEVTDSKFSVFSNSGSLVIKHVSHMRDGSVEADWFTVEASPFRTLEWWGKLDEGVVYTIQSFTDHYLIPGGVNELDKFVHYGKSYRVLDGTECVAEISGAYCDPKGFKFADGEKVVFVNGVFYALGAPYNSVDSDTQQ